MVSKQRETTKDDGRKEQAERQRETERQRKRERDREREREREGEGGREREREREGEGERSPIIHLTSRHLGHVGRKRTHSTLQRTINPKRKQIWGI